MDQPISVHNVQTKIRIFLYRQELALITVQQGNSLTREQEVALTVRLLVRYAQELINAHLVKKIFFFIMELADKIALLIWLQVQTRVNA
jgi:hypothetical protein